MYVNAISKIFRYGTYIPTCNDMYERLYKDLIIIISTISPNSDNTEYAFMDKCSVAFPHLDMPITIIVWANNYEVII